MTSAIILAGGLGTRLRSIVSDVPKPMAPIEGRPFLEYLLEYWIAEGIDHFILSVGYRHEIITQHFGDLYQGARIDYVVEKEPLDTGGGLLLASRLLADEAPFVLLNGDTYFAVSLATLTQYAQMKDADWVFSLFSSEETSRYMGMHIDASGRITNLKAKSGKVNGGVYWVHPRALRALSFQMGARISLEEELFPAALHGGQRLFGMTCESSFIDVGVPEDYVRASNILIK